MTTRRFYIALASFAALAGGAAITLTGLVRLAVWVFLAGLAAKSWIAWLQWRAENR